MRMLSLLLAVACLMPAGLRAQPLAAAGWTGTWRGELTNAPARGGVPRVEVTRVIGAMPTTDSSCTAFRTTYREQGVVRGEKAYQLCRGAGADDWYVDEGGGLRLSARWLGDALVSPFKYDSLLLISTVRLRDGVLEEEIVTIDDRPAINGVQPLRARSLQRLVLRRADP